MNDASELIINIEESISKIIFLRENDRKEAAELKKRIVELQNIIQEQKTQIEQLKQKLTTSIVINKSLEKEEENKQAKLEISEIMREIDRIIGMLNS